MSSLKLHQLLLLSNTQKEANRFIFHNRLNLITSYDINNVGKSTLAHLLFWGFGCELRLDTNWTLLDCKTMIEFSIKDKFYYIHRDKNAITVLLDIKQENNKVKYQDRKVFNKITGEFSAFFASLVNFKLKLPSRKKGFFETPPPAFYFLPFYIDQEKTWVNSWDNFENLHQYENWKKDLIKYDVGLISDRYFEIQEELSFNRKDTAVLQSKVKNIETTFDVLKEYLPQKSMSIDEATIEKITQEIQEELTSLIKEQETIYNNLAQLESEKTQLVYQKDIAQKLVYSYEKDYIFAVENIPDDYIECPLCGQIHENSVINRASILADKVSAERQYEEIDKFLPQLEKEIYQQKEKIIRVKERIDVINNKYIKEGNEEVSFTDAINGIVEFSLRQRVVESKKDLLNKKSNLSKQKKDLEKERRELQSKEDKEASDNLFVSIFKKYMKELSVENINMAEINSPLDYSKIYKEGGAAEKIRSILAYYFTIYEMIRTTDRQVIAPFVIDTPNQQEQSTANYDKIINCVLRYTSSDNQVFLCAMMHEQLAPFIEQGKVIVLDEKKLLRKDVFLEVSNIFNSYGL